MRLGMVSWNVLTSNADFAQITLEQDFGTVSVDSTGAKTLVLGTPYTISAQTHLALVFATEADATASYHCAGISNHHTYGDTWAVIGSNIWAYSIMQWVADVTTQVQSGFNSWSAQTVSRKRSANASGAVMVQWPIAMTMEAA